MAEPDCAQLLRGVLSPLLLSLLAVREPYGYERVQRLGGLGLDGTSPTPS